MAHSRAQGRPGRGSPHFTLRFKPELMEGVLAAVERANRHANRRGPAEPYTLRSWVVAAVRRELAHLERARRQSMRRRKGVRGASRAEMTVSNGVTKNPAEIELTGAAA
jgi:hypothetical protein